uniref:Uncharacterized protein n=1 Tax=Anguilla anguilla TaxID=7936 RepID=A0A0E9R993_ANGAN
MSLLSCTNYFLTLFYTFEGHSTVTILAELVDLFVSCKCKP